MKLEESNIFRSATDISEVNATIDVISFEVISVEYKIDFTELEALYETKLEISRFQPIRYICLSFFL